LRSETTLKTGRIPKSLISRKKNKRQMILNISKLEEILNPYENSIDNLEKKLSVLVESCYKDTYTLDSDFEHKREFLKTVEEVISEFLRLGLSDKDAMKAEQALQMSKDGQYDNTNDDIEKLTKALSDSVEEMFEDLFKDEPENKKSDLE
jgi:hypothetical protein